jgi:hypothetical protein
MSNIRIPRGRQIEILRDGESILPGFPLTIENDVTLSVSSSFNPLFSGGDPIQKLITQIGKAIASVGGTGFGGTLKQMGIQVWESTDPLSLNLVMSFYLGMKNQWDGLEEVKRPIFELMKLTLPSEGKGGTLIAPGPSPLDVFKGVNEKLNIKTQTISLDLGGILYLPEIIVKEVQPTFGKEIDDNGYPVWGQVSVDIQTLFIATSDLLDDELEIRNQTASNNEQSNREDAQRRGL